MATRNPLVLISGQLQELPSSDSISRSGSLITTTGEVDVSLSTTPIVGQVLTATSSNSAIWQTPGGSGGTQVLSVQIDLGSNPKSSGSFTISGLFVVGKVLIITQALGPYASKGSIADEIEMDQLTIAGYVVNTSTANCVWASGRNLVCGFYQFNYWQSI